MKLLQSLPGRLLRHNLREVIFVFLAFALMVITAYFSVGYILRDRLLDRAEEMISVAEANVRAGLSDSETILMNTHHFVQGMINQNASKQEILDYLTTTTNWMRQREHGLFSYYGVYGYIDGDFYDSMGLNPGDDYIPQTRPWYQTAIRSGNAIGYTTPYRDWRTGDTIVSAVKNIFTLDGQLIGILAIDVEISWLIEYVGSLTTALDGYGILVNQNMTLIAHPENENIGLQLQSLGSSYEEIVRILHRDGDVIARRIEDKSGSPFIVFFTRIFNGWYIGIVTPYHQFYMDLYISAGILIFLGLILSILLCYMLLRISAAKIQADEDNKYKTSFLASMSHEIRTPMNAITGMAEILLRSDLSGEARSYAQDIKQAGNNLISIINDILDFSKIEAGRLEIIPVNYKFSSVIDEVINIIRMRIGEKQIELVSNIDENIPDSLIGDEIRVRQIIINLLSNAVKYTERGYINFSVTQIKKEDGKIWLKITVKDTGVGIKPEDQAKLFGDYVQVDIRKNVGIEGTGLGLAITKRLCLAMDGDISVESEYGKGSVFTVIIPQLAETDALVIEQAAAVKQTKAVKPPVKAGASPAVSANDTRKKINQPKVHRINKRHGFRKQTLFGQLFFSFILINVLIIASVMTSFTFVYSKSYETQVAEENNQKGEYVSLSLYSFLHLAYKLVEELSYNTDVLSMDTEKQTRIFIETAERNDFFELLYAQGMDGMQTGRSWGGLANRGDRWWFIHMAQTKKPYITETYISVGTDMACTSIYFPMWSPDNPDEMIGIMAADIKLSSIHDLILKNSDEYLYSFIIDRLGVVVAHPDQRFVDELYNYSTFTKTVLLRDAEGNPIKDSAGYDTEEVPFQISDAYKTPIQSMMRGNRGWTKFKEDGKLLYLNYLPVELDGNSDPWYVVTIRDGDHAMQTRNTVILLILASALVISLATLLIIYFVSRRISSPIKNVYSILQKIKDGDLTSVITVSTQDEIGEMMGMLDQTQEGIKKLINNIEKEAQARLRADEESRAKTSFLAKMSHEIRTPINTVTGMTELLLREELSNETRSLVQDIKKAGSNLVSIINNILDFSKIESGNLEIMSVEYELSSLVSDTGNIIRNKLMEKSVQFNIDIKDDVPNKLIGDKTRLRQILLNLLSNALKYTEKGCIGLSITAEKINIKRVWLKIAVSDTGIGIKQEDQAILFDEFARVDVDKNQSIEGTGLGLAITKRLCHSMDGEIKVESEYGAGSTFTVIIPQDINTGEITDNTIYKKETAHLHARILVVDDIPTNLKVAEGLLRPYKAKIDTCQSGERAIELVKQNKYDLVFMDHLMPLMDGIETTVRIRAWEKEQVKNGLQAKRLPVIMLTANAVVGMREMFLEKGLDDFLAKPIDISKLDEIMERWLSSTEKEQLTKSEKTAGDEQIPVIPGVDVIQGIKNTGGTLEYYFKVLSVFSRDLIEKLQFLKTQPDKPDKSSLQVLKSNVHALKSALATLGAKENSAEAAALEAACNKEDINYINENLPAFTEQLSELKIDIDNTLESFAGANENDFSSAAFGKYLSLFLDLAEALKSKDALKIESVVEEISRKPLDSGTKQVMEQISGEILMTEYNKALQILNKMIIIS
ncbi:MAG: ATP-binding protein [Treponema sp.]|nr:ATP-binding protein [Treponema sp.]